MELCLEIVGDIGRDLDGLGSRLLRDDLSDGGDNRWDYCRQKTRIIIYCPQL